MKFVSIKRAIRANRHDRSPGDAPNLGRLARMPGTGIPRRLRWHRVLGGARAANAAKGLSLLSKIWTALLLAMVVISLGVALWLWVSPKIASGKADAPQAAVETGPESEPVAQVRSPSEAEALSLVKRAVAMRDPATVERVFRLGTSSPAEVVRFLESMESMDGRIADYRWLSSLDVNRLTVDGVAVRFEDPSGRRNRLALLTPDPSGVWKVDFEAFARTVRPTWPEIVGHSFETAVVRVFFVKDTYFNGPFRDENEWICLTLKSPERDEVFFGYCRAGSPQAAAIHWIFSKTGMVPSRVTLEIRSVAGASPSQFEISRVLAEDWLVTDVPFDEGFK